MEFNFELWQVFQADSDKVCVLDGMTKGIPLKHAKVVSITNQSTWQTTTLKLKMRL